MSWPISRHSRLDALALRALAPGGNRVERLVDKVLAEDLNDVPVLNLNDGLWQHDLPIVAETDAAVDAFEIHLRDRVAHVVGLDRAGRLDRIDQCLDRSHRRGDMVVGCVAELCLERFEELTRV